MNDNPGLGPDGAAERARIAHITRRKLHTTRSRRNNPITQAIKDDAAALQPLDDYAGKRPRPLSSP